jgi:hypothetical protein
MNSKHEKRSREKLIESFGDIKEAKEILKKFPH